MKIKNTIVIQKNKVKTFVTNAKKSKKTNSQISIIKTQLKQYLHKYGYSANFARMKNNTIITIFDNENYQELIWLEVNLHSIENGTELINNIQNSAPELFL